MAIRIDPLLRPFFGPDKAVADDTTASETPVVDSAPEAAQEAEAPVEEVSTEEVAPEEDYFIKLDKRNLYQELARLEQEDQAFRNILNSKVGRKAKRDYQPEIERLTRERDKYLQDLRAAEIKAMKPEEIEQRYATDGQFAREYTEAIHPQPASPVDEFDRQLESAAQRALDETLERALAVGVNPAVVETRLKEFENALVYCPVHQTDQHSFFAHEADGAGGWRYHQNPARALQLFERGLMTDRAFTAPPPPPAAPKPPQAAQAATATKPRAVPNPALAEATPDLSPTTGSNGASRGRMSVSEYKAMPPSERFRLLGIRNIDDYERMRKNGEIYDG